MKDCALLYPVSCVGLLHEIGNMVKTVLAYSQIFLHCGLYLAISHPVKWYNPGRWDTVINQGAFNRHVHTDYGLVMIVHVALPEGVVN
jgi:hypothetical protein